MKKSIANFSFTTIASGLVLLAFKRIKRFRSYAQNYQEGTILYKSSPAMPGYFYIGLLSRTEVKYPVYYAEYNACQVNQDFAYTQNNRTGL